MRGAHARGQEHHAQVLELYDASAHHSLFMTFGFDPKSIALANYGWSLCLSGWPEQAWSWEQRALECAEELAHPLSLVNTLMCAIFVRGFRGEYDAALALTEQLSTLVSEHGLADFPSIADMFRGVMSAGRGELERGHAIRAADLSQFRTSLVRVLLPYFLSFLADASLQHGQVESGVATVAEALGLTATDLDRFWEAELYRLQGELTLQQEKSKAKIKNQKAKGKNQKAKVPKPQSHIPEPQSEAEACFLKAIEVARQQGAKSLELRAAMSMSRLWQQQGKRKEARTLLRRSMAGSQKVLTRKTCKRRKTLLDALRA